MPKKGNKRGGGDASLKNQLKTTESKFQDFVVSVQKTLASFDDEVGSKTYRSRFISLKSSVETCLQHVCPETLQDQISLSRKRRRSVVTQTSAKKSRTVALGLLGLPDEVLVKILGFLPTSHLLTKASLVCQRFERLSRDPDIQLSFRFRLDMNLTAISAFFMNRRYQISHLVFYYSTYHFMDVINQFIPTMNRLKSVHIHTHSHTGMIPLDFLEALFQCQSLVKFSTSSLYGISNLEEIIYARNLRHVKIDYSEISLDLLDRLLSLPKLNTLEFHVPCTLNPSSFASKFSTANIPELRNLKLMLPVVSTSWLTIFSKNPIFKQLQSLSIVQVRSFLLSSVNLDDYKSPVTLSSVKSLVMGSPNLRRFEVSSFDLKMPKVLRRNMWKRTCRGDHHTVVLHLEESEESGRKHLLIVKKE